MVFQLRQCKLCLRSSVSKCLPLDRIFPNAYHFSTKVVPKRNIFHTLNPTFKQATSLPTEMLFLLVQLEVLHEIVGAGAPIGIA